jgi:phosphoribosylformylglycinamidine cyclo-ligase
MSKDNRYLRRGVSSQKEDVHKAIKNTDKGLFPYAFCKVVPDYLGGDAEYCNVMHADGAGTKSSLAYLYWKETGDLSVWKGLAQDSIVMNLDDLLCIGITDNFLLSSTIGRNKHKIPGEVISAVIEGTNEFIETMNALGVRIISTGGETADVGDLVRTIIVDSTITARCKRNEILENNIQPGNVIVGLASFGRSKYENYYNEGMGSNGLTSARHDLLHKSYKSTYPESFDTDLDDDIVYCGKHRLEDKLEGFQNSIGKAILSPTRTYAPVFNTAFKEMGKHTINGIIHCTGGAQTKVLKFCDKVHIIKDNLFETPPLFKEIQACSGTSGKEMYEVFNMGHRMELYLDESKAQELISISEAYGIDAKIIGRVEKSEGKSLSIVHHKQTYTW